MKRQVIDAASSIEQAPNIEESDARRAKIMDEERF
jgi:hypothetical protein